MTRRLKPDSALVSERKRYVAARKREAAKDRSKTPVRDVVPDTWRRIVAVMGGPS